MDINYEIYELKKQQEKMLALLEGLKRERIDRIYDLTELMKILNVSRRTIATWMSKGLLPCSQIGKKIYVTSSQLQEFLEKYQMNNHK